MNKIDKEKVIDGLRFTMAMILFNPMTGNEKQPSDLNEDDRTTYNACIGAIKLLSAQPEIIRCSNCKYMTEHYDTDGNAPYWTCSEWDSGTDYDGFCHYAERRTE